jgi:hypothetical protein
MAKSQNLTSGQFPTMGTSAAENVTAVGPRGSRVVPKKGFGKSGDPVLEPHDLKGRNGIAETSGARYAVTVSRAYPPDKFEDHGHNTRMLAPSHSQSASWSGAYDEFGQGISAGR